MENILEIKNLSKMYGARYAVKDLSLTVKAGEVYGFIGPNGAGKTTTIRIIVGLASATAGEVIVCGHSIKTDFENAIRNVGGIIENPELYNFLTGRQNLQLFAGLYEGITKERIDEVIKLVALENRIDDRMKKYSLGMRQRVGIAQSLLHRPKILILDEPTNGLDPSGIREMRDLLKKLAHEEGVAVFISSHILSEMQQLCDRAAIIDNGKLIQVLTIDELNKSVSGNFVIKVSDGALAAEILRKHFADRDITNEGELVYARLSEQDIPSALRHLIKGSIDVFGAKKVDVNLEAMFLDATKDSRIN